MKIFETIALLLVGLINFLPLLGILGVKHLKKLYGLDLEDTSIVLLMRHRAVLFGIIGGFIIYSVFFPIFVTVAYIFGAISMGTFVLLALPIKNHTKPIRKVFYIDMVAIIMLVLAWLSVHFPLS